MGKAERKNRKDLVVVCHNIRSAFNVGAIFRTADGAGVAKVYLTGYTPVPPHVGVVKTALGAEKTVLWEKFAKISSALEKLKCEGYELVALEQAKKSVPYDFFNFRRKVALILGNEVRGLSPALLRKCDEIVEIPMRGKKESLNVGVAFGIAIYSMTSER